MIVRPLVLTLLTLTALAQEEDISDTTEAA